MSGWRTESNTPSEDSGSSATRRKAEMKSVLYPSPEASIAASNFAAAPLERKTATTTSSMPSEMAKNHDTGRRFILCLIFCMPTSFLALRLCLTPSKVGLTPG